MGDFAAYKTRIETLLGDRSLVRTPEGSAIDEVVALLDTGALRVAEPAGDEWITHAWVKSAILLYFMRHPETPSGTEDNLRYFDIVPPKRDFDRLGIRCVPPGVVKFGSYVAPGVIVLSGFVNIGAHVGADTMIDTWALVGTCAQVGAGVHVSAGAIIGGVLEPLQASPVIVEDGAFVGANATVVEGVHVERGAVIGAGTTLTASTPIVDLRGDAPPTTGRVPAGAVVIPGTMQRERNGISVGLPCAVIVGSRDSQTDERVEINQLLRRSAEEHGAALEPYRPRSVTI
jgi:2,3,4,5-tetrahydropyridine-2-carboxylate N-succinyltransferase